MNTFRNYAAMLVLSLFLFACGGSDIEETINNIAGQGEGTENNQDNIADGDSRAIVDGVDITGVWRGSVEEDGEEAEVFIAFNANGTVSVYFDTDECFVKVSSSIAGNEDGSFTLDDEENASISIDGNTMTIDAGSESFTLVRSSRTESSFTPLCDINGGFDDVGEFDNNGELTDVTGVWNGTEVSDQGTDVYYVVIKANGTYIGYDYDGDSFDKGDNCYYIDQGTYADLGNGQFLLNGNDLVDITVNNDQMTTAYPNGDSETMNRISLDENSFLPECED